ncbi:gephyrin-like molybdotransferase Glp [Clostridium estertheticum]|uniref:Molybdopterin molybdenumtransferase n=1 Tax=Clostridium estertheticum TaxID=238834 RepID=A0AA47EFL2_9CLOT|nr:gephyrin-like molybdotransferase Glp [Clostridium estertheticum]MBU3156547.1 molybdopterin molybdotransferase MoeA [Clostridium estertheticum]WAG59308.1 molybdopterin molybdotransferase MoeA [Clostridium estertheticum]
MKHNLDFEYGRDLLINLCTTLPTEEISISESVDRVLAEDIRAVTDVPPFDRSPYDGYAFFASDTTYASQDRPVTLRILEEVAAGSVPTQSVVEGTAIKILTGAPVPIGADAIVKYEDTNFSKDEVTLYGSVSVGSNIVPAGEDVKAGDLLAEKGTVIDPSLVGVLAAQGILTPLVYRQPMIGILSTGNELLNAEDAPSLGKIHDINRYALEAACLHAGALPVFLGCAKDIEEDIRFVIEKGLDSCDMIISTGGVCVGDYDRTPAALELLGAEIMVRDLFLKPGGACIYARKGGKMICCLSGNTASSMTNFYAVTIPLIRKLSGRSRTVSVTTYITLANDFPKRSPKTRLLRGKLELDSGQIRMRIPENQKNGVLHSMIGCNVLAVVPAGSQALAKGTVLKAYLID